MIRVENDGQEIVSTNYWRSDLAARGLVFLSINAGAARLLLPGRLSIEIMRETAEADEAILTRGLLRGRECYELLWDDGTATPYVLTIDAEQSDRLLAVHDSGRELPLFLYGPHDGLGKLCLRRGQCRFRCAPLPCLAPWKD